MRRLCRKASAIFASSLDSYRNNHISQMQPGYQQRDALGCLRGYESWHCHALSILTSGTCNSQPEPNTGRLFKGHNRGGEFSSQACLEVITIQVTIKLNRSLAYQAYLAFLWVMNISLRLSKCMKRLTKEYSKGSGLESHIYLPVSLLCIFLGPQGRCAKHFCERLIGFQSWSIWRHCGDSLWQPWRCKAPHTMLR